MPCSIGFEVFNGLDIAISMNKTIYIEERCSIHSKAYGCGVENLLVVGQMHIHTPEDWKKWIFRFI